MLYKIRKNGTHRVCLCCALTLSVMERSWSTSAWQLSNFRIFPVHIYKLFGCIDISQVYRQYTMLQQQHHTHTHTQPPTTHNSMQNEMSKQQKTLIKCCCPSDCGPPLRLHCALASDMAIKRFSCCFGSIWSYLSRRARRTHAVVEAS